MLWEAMTSGVPEKRAPTDIGQLTGHEKVTAKTLSLSTLKSEAGLVELIEEIDWKSVSNYVTLLLHSKGGTFFDFV